MDEKLHVLMIPSWYRTKEQPVHGSFFHEHALALAAAGVRMGVLYPEIRQLRGVTPKRLLHYHFQRSVGMEGPLPTCRLHGWNLFPKWMKKQMEAWSYFAEKLLPSYIKQFGRPDLIHAQSSVWAGIAAKRIGEKWGIPYCLTEHASVFMKQKVLGKRWQECWSTPYIREACDGAAALVAVSTALKQALRPYTRRESDAIRVIPNLIDTNLFIPKRGKQSGSFRFLTIAHLVPRKNVDLLLKAFKLICQDDSQADLTIGGEGPERVHLEKMVEALKLQTRVRFLGPLSREEAARAYQGADAFVLASQHETFGVVCIEALASGIPVIATRSGGTQDIVSKEVGYLVAVQDVESLAKAMARIKEETHRFDPLALHQLAVQRYSSEAVAQQYIQLYSETRFR